MTVNSYPLAWPEGWKRTPDHQRRTYGPFKTTFDRARQQLVAEVQRLGGRDLVISSWLAIRNDGMPYADQARRRIDDPGVAIYFTKANRQMVMARDAFSSVHDNLRSIGLAIEHLRGLERHGGSTMMDRAFEGFAALPPPADMVKERPWREVLGMGEMTGPNDLMLTLAEGIYRKKAKNSHPDTAGGDHDAMAELTRAIEEARRELV